MESYEGGCRTPMIVHWPAGLKASAGTLVKDVAHVIDIAPTCYELANAETRAGTFRDGISLTPVLRGETIADDRQLYFDHGNGGGIREKNWKASRLGNQSWQLFDLAKDPGETQDLSETEPEILERLVESWTKWRAEVSQSPEKQISRRESVGAAVE